MIQINDNDLPIQVAEKIISGTKPTDLSEALRNATEKMFGFKIDTQDMFSIEEIEEIASYLMVYVNSHKNGDA